MIRNEKQWKTKQEAFWAGEFGDAYISRNRDAELVQRNSTLFKEIFASNLKLRSIVELGANIGLNLRAFKKLFPAANLAAVEINSKAVSVLKQLNILSDIFHGSLLDYRSEKPADLSFTKGVLIHIAPEYLAQAYESLYRASSKYILIAEYYNPTPVTVTYRGHKGKLFKRDFAGELLAKYPDLKLVKYGFAYHGDPKLQMDDLTWFLLKKKGHR